MSRLSSLRQLDPKQFLRDTGRLVQLLDEMFDGLAALFVERWKTQPVVVTSSTDRPSLKFGELMLVDSRGGDIPIFLPLASRADAGRKVQFVKQYSDNEIELVATGSALVNLATRSDAITAEERVYEIWWDGQNWWQAT
jgi:hypothetical protein